MFNPERPPEITAARWLNSAKPRSLKAEKGKVVVVAVTQITCPGSQKYGLPQAMRVRAAFAESEVAVFALSMPFEKHAEQTAEKVQAYLDAHEITIPVALDKPNGEELPQTMVDYELQGTPAILVFDRQGRLRRHYLGAVDDLRLGAEVMTLLIEDADSPREMSIVLERKMHAALVDPREHEHGGCGCGHDHGHDHDHDHDHGHHHAHGEGGCCGGGGGGCGGQGKCRDEHDHDHAHGAHDHHHDHDHDHDHGHSHGAGGCGGTGQCGCGAKDAAK